MSYILLLITGLRAIDVFLIILIKDLKKNYDMFFANMTEGMTLILDESEERLNVADNEIDKQIKELKHEFHEALTDRPEILKYIERLHTIIRRQQKKLNKFYNKLKDHKLVKKYTTDNKESQTEKWDEDHESNIERNIQWDSTFQNSGKSIVEEVKEVAENAMKQTGFVYEPTSGMYYDYNTGYYYNAELRMYYDGNTGRYLEYDEETKEYKYHSTVDGDSGDNSTMPDYYKSQPPSQRIVKKSWDKKKDRKAKKSKLDEAEEGEITESSISGSEASVIDDEKEVSTDVHDGAFGCEPCIRIIVEETNVDKLKVGSLFVVTCKGGTMGREGDHAVLIPDINVSKHHAKFVFSEKTSTYYILDLGSRNGTWLDGERLSAALQESETFKINHGAIIQIGSTKLLCHVHDGRDTCSSCEPGLVQQMTDGPLWDPALKNPEYKEQLQSLKKKFGVDGTFADVYNVPGYEDRAEIRRATVGSSHPSEKTETASASEVIPHSNKGFKMLSKMGWSEGQKLGKNERGITEPVSLSSTMGKAGLGVKSVETASVSAHAKRKLEVLRKTRDRYRNVEESQGSTESDEGIGTEEFHAWKLKKRATKRRFS